MNNNEDLLMAKMIKLYVMHHPNCTAKQISVFFSENKFGIKTNYTAREISKLIKVYNKTPQNVYKWFNIEVIHEKGKSLRYVVKK